MSTLIHTRRKHPPTQVESNLTSMIDVVFLLIVFFVLVSQVVSREAEPLDLPEVPDAAAAVAGAPASLQLWPPPLLVSRRDKRKAGG